MLCIKFLLISIESLTLGTKVDSISQNIPLRAGLKRPLNMEQVELAVEYRYLSIEHLPSLYPF